MIPKRPAFEFCDHPSMPAEVYWNKLMQSADDPDGPESDRRFF